MKELITLPRIIRVDLRLNDDDQVDACLQCQYKTSPWTCGVFGTLPDSKRHQRCKDAEIRYLDEHYRNG